LKSQIGSFKILTCFFDCSKLIDSADKDPALPPLPTTCTVYYNSLPQSSACFNIF